jgi:hypothetical protein
VLADDEPDDAPADDADDAPDDDALDPEPVEPFDDEEDDEDVEVPSPDLATVLAEDRFVPSARLSVR